MEEKIMRNYYEGEKITKAIITWADSEYENELEIENDGDENDSFMRWIEENAEELAMTAAAEQGTTFEELVSIDYDSEPEEYDEEGEYINWCEFMWECRTGR
jgi:hypothetical protein